MSAYNYYGTGDTEKMSDCLDEILLHAKTFEDTLEASVLLAKLLASSTSYDEALKNCLDIVAKLGESFPEQISLPIVLNELHSIESTLKELSIEQIKSLPQMKDANKLSTMKFLNLMATYSFQTKPLLLPLVACRMVRITMDSGYSEHSLVGFVLASYGLVSICNITARLRNIIGGLPHLLVSIDAVPHHRKCAARLSYWENG